MSIKEAKDIIGEGWVREIPLEKILRKLPQDLHKFAVKYYREKQIRFLYWSGY